MSDDKSKKIYKYSKDAIVASEEFLDKLNLTKEQKDVLILCSQLGSISFLEEVNYIYDTLKFKHSVGNLSKNQLFLYSLAYSLQVQNKLTELFSADEDFNKQDLL